MYLFCIIFILTLNIKTKHYVVCLLCILGVFKGGFNKAYDNVMQQTVIYIKIEKKLSLAFCFSISAGSAQENGMKYRSCEGNIKAQTESESAAHAVNVCAEAGAAAEACACLKSAALSIIELLDGYGPPVPGSASSRSGLQLMPPHPSLLHYPTPLPGSSLPHLCSFPSYH